MPDRTTILGKISDLPSSPAIYALYGGRGNSAYVAYVGITNNLKRRVVQHLVNQDSSVTTGTSAVSVNPEQISKVCFWSDRIFGGKSAREAAEMVADEVLTPVLRSRGRRSSSAQITASRVGFRKKARAILRGPPTGVLMVPKLSDVLDRVERIEERLATLVD